MKDKKVCIRQFAFYDRTGIVEYLEQKALEGWKLVKSNMVIWRFVRIDSKPLKYAVSYFTKASQFDPEPTSEQKDFEEFCKHAGWKRVAEYGELKIFCNENESAIPIETDPELELEAIKKAGRSNYLLVFYLYLFNGLIQLAFWAIRFSTNKIGFLKNDCNLLGIPCALTICVISIVQLAKYFNWCRRAEKAAREEGEFIPTKCANNMIIVDVAFILAGLGLLWGSLTGGNAVGLVMPIVGTIICTAICVGICAILKKIKISAKANLIATYVSAVISALVLVFLLIVYGENITSTDEDVDSSLFLNIANVVMMDEKNSLNVVDYSYSRVEVKADFVYDFVKKEMLKTNRDSYSVDIYGNVFYDEYKAIDGDEWGVDEAYVLSNDGVELNEYVMCEDNIILYIKGYEALTPEVIEKFLYE